MALDTLADLSLLHIASYLTDTEVLALSSMNRRLFHLLGNDSKIWSKLIMLHGLTIFPSIETAARDSSLSGCKQKKLFLICRKIRNNFKTGKCKQVPLSHTSASLYPWVGQDCVYWPDWPDRYLDFFHALRLPTILLQDWNGVTKKFRSRAFLCPESLSRFSKLKVLVNLEQFVAVLVVDQPHGIMHSVLDDISGNSTRRKLIALDIGSENLEFLWSHSFGVVKDRVFMSGGKICSVSRTKIDFFNVRTGEQNSININRNDIKLNLKFSGHDDTLVYNDFFAAFSAYNGVLVVDTVNEIAFGIDETDPYFRGFGPIYMQGNRLAKFTSSQYLSVWDLKTGNRSDVEQLSLPDHYELSFAHIISEAQKSFDKFKLVYLLQMPDNETITTVEEYSNRSKFHVKSNFLREIQIIRQSSTPQHWQPCRGQNATVVHNLAMRVNVPSLWANWKGNSHMWRSLQLEAASVNGADNSISLSTIEIADDYDANRFDIKNVFFTATSMIVVYVHDTYYPPGKAEIKIFDFSP